MIDFVGTPQFLRTALLGYGNHAFSHNTNKFILGEHFFHILGIQGNNLAPMENCHVGCKVGQIRFCGI